MENCQIGVFLACGSRRGRTFLDRELYLPQAWAEDGERRWEAGVPEAVSFHTKGQLARVMIARALAAGVPFGWVAGDTVYGNDRRLRQWLEEQKIPHVLAVKNNDPLWADTEDGAAQVAARRLAQGIPADQWQRLSAGEGSKGPRLYDWGRVLLLSWSEPDQGHWLLVRRSITDPEDLAYYACFSPVEVALAELVRVAGTRWIIEDAFKFQGGQAGGGFGRVRGAPLDWVVPAYHFGPAGPRLSGGDPLLRRRCRRKRGAVNVAELIPMTVPEVRRLLCRLLWQRPQRDDLTVRWSRWRRRHQARAWQSHRKRRLQTLRNHVRL